MNPELLLWMLWARSILFLAIFLALLLSVFLSLSVCLPVFSPVNHKSEKQDVCNWPLSELVKNFPSEVKSWSTQCHSSGEQANQSGLFPRSITTAKVHSETIATTVERLLFLLLPAPGHMERTCLHCCCFQLPATRKERKKGNVDEDHFFHPNCSFYSNAQNCT